VYCTFGAVILTAKSAQDISVWGEAGNEGAAVYVALLAARTGHLYYPLASPPYTPQPYGPFFYAVNSIIARISHFDANLTVRRSHLLTFGSFLLCGLTVYVIDRRLRFSHTSSALAALMLLSQPAFLGFNVLTRPDVPCLLLMLVCLLLALLEGQIGQLAYVFSGLLAGSAFLVKQSAVTVAISIMVTLLFRKRYRQTALLALSAAVPLVLVFGILLARREPFMQHFTSIGHTLWSVSAGARWVTHYLAETANVLPLAIGSVGFVSAITGDEQSQMIASFTLVNVLAGFATIPQLGGSINYFLPALAGCALLLPFAMRTISRNVSAAMATSILAIVGLLSATAGIAIAARDFQLGSAREWQKATYERLHSLRIISDTHYIPVYGRDPELLDSGLMHALELTKYWDPSSVIESIRHGDFDLAILTCGRVICSWRGLSFFGIPIVNSLNENYEVLCTAGRVLVLKPRIRKVGATPEWLGSVLGRPCISSTLDRAPNLSIADGAR
jgi:Dolichyl-phosphate-mannose-protein mannosyltransferase